MSEEVHGLMAPHPLRYEGMADPRFRAVWIEGLCFLEGLIGQLEQKIDISPSLESSIS